jgi:hypothetical protein
MNPMAFVILGLGILLIIIGIKGSQHALLGALKGEL